MERIVGAEILEPYPGYLTGFESGLRVLFNLKSSAFLFIDRENKTMKLIGREAMSTIRQRPAPARSLRYLLAAALLVAPAAFPRAVSAIEIKNFQGDGTCPDGWTPLTFADAVANKSAACGALAQWDIARLGSGGSLDGAGYNCKIRSSDMRKLGNSLCARRETLEPGKLKVCLYPGFQPFVGKEAGHWSGLDVKYLQQFAKEQNLAFIPVESEKFAGIWAFPGEGKCDIAASGISDLPSRREQTSGAGDWSDHYYQVYRAFAVRSEDLGKLEKIQGLKGKTVIVTGGSTADSDLVNRLACAHVTSVKIERTSSEEDAARKVLAGKAFAYGGGLGSIVYLTEKLGKGLSVVWTHCNMQANCKEGSEPFSFVVRHASIGLTQALNEYIAKTRYPGPDATGPSCPPEL